MWWLFAFLSAAAQVSRNIVMKDLGHKLDEYINVLGRFVFILPFALFITLYKGIPKVPSIYWLFAALAGFFVAISTMYLSKAFKYSDISLTVAIWKLSVILLLVLEVIFLKAKIAPFGILGIVITVAGVYLLNIKKAQLSIWKPFIHIFEDKGMKYAILAAIFLAPAFLFFKITTDLSDAYFPAFTNYLFATLFTLPSVFKISASSYKTLLKHWHAFVLMGFFAFLTTIFAGIGYQKSFATYVEAVKQSEVLFALVAGLVFFHEHERVKEIWVGCCVIIIGICFVIFNS